MRSLFGCGFILTGTHPSIVENENVITAHARTLVNSEIETDVGVKYCGAVPTMACNRAVATLRVPEFFEAEELGVAPARSCKRCRGCRDCNFRNALVSREKEMVV